MPATLRVAGHPAVTGHQGDCQAAGAAGRREIHDRAARL